MFLRDLNKFCSACIKERIMQYDHFNFCCITADPGVLDKDALVEAAEAVDVWWAWIWNGCSMMLLMPEWNGVLGESTYY